MFEALFDRIGQKIKNLAIVIFVLEVLGSILGGFIFGLNMLWNMTQMEIHPLSLLLYLVLVLLTSILVVILGILLSWVSVFLLYGFGELIDRASNLDDQFDQMSQLYIQSLCVSTTRKNGAQKQSAAEANLMNNEDLAKRVEYALNLQDYHAMVNYLQKVDDSRIATILKGPKDMVRNHLKNLLDQLTAQ